MFGDVLRGLGSVLSPQVMQQVEAERAREAATQQQMGGMVLQDRFAQAREQRALETQKASPEYQMKIDALKNEQNFRVGASKLDPNAPDYYDNMAKLATQNGKPEVAASIFKAKEDRAGRLQSAAEAVQFKRDKLESDNKLAQERLTDSRDRQAWQQTYQQQMLGLHSQNAGINQQLRMMGLEIQRSGQEMKLAQINQTNTDRDEKQIEAQIGKTADRMKDVQPVWTSAKQLNGILSRYTPDEVPGLGYAKNTNNGKLFLSGEGQDVSSSVKLFGNSVLKAMSGAAVTAPEEVRLMAAQMADGRYSAKEFYIAWPKMSAWVNDQMSLATAGLTPAAKAKFLDRTGIKIDPIIPRFTFDGKQLVDTKAPSKPSAVPAPPPGFKVD